jgi:hypothetical protein
MVFTLHYLLFDIPSYDTRIYVYEPDVLYGYSVPSFEGKGFRCSLMIRFPVGRKVDLWLKGGCTYYTDRQVIGSGPDQISGNARYDLTGQFMIRI